MIWKSFYVRLYLFRPYLFRPIFTNKRKLVLFKDKEKFLKQFEYCKNQNYRINYKLHTSNFKCKVFFKFFLVISLKNRKFRVSVLLVRLDEGN